MYFCPCSSDDPIESEPEDNALFSLPRNLSYVHDSYLDRYSVSAQFVHNPKIERCIQRQQGQEWRANVEDETLGLLSAITAQELHGRSDGDFESVNSSGFVFSRQDSSTGSGFSKTTSQPTSSWTPGSSNSSFSATSLLHPASLVASKISAFLHSPPNESMDSARDVGTSVDAENLLLPDTLSRMDPSLMEYPDSSGEEMDRGDRVQFYSSSLSGESDIEDREEHNSKTDNDIHNFGSFGHEGFSEAITASEGFSEAITASEGFSEAITASEGFSEAITAFEGFSEAITASGNNVLNILCLKDVIDDPHRDHDPNIVWEFNDNTQVITPHELSRQSVEQPYCSRGKAHLPIVDVDVNRDDMDAIHKGDTDDIDKVHTDLLDTVYTDILDKVYTDIVDKVDTDIVDTVFDTDIMDKVETVTDSGSSHESLKYSKLMSLTVEGKNYIPKEGSNLDIEREGGDRIAAGSVTNTLYGSPDSDAFSEEGVFMNIDDFDSTNEKSTTVSDASDDTCVSVDSMFLSPEEEELIEDNVREISRKMTLEEAINRAASDLTKMSLGIYGSEKPSGASETSSSLSLIESDEILSFPLIMANRSSPTNRSSPVRITSGLKIKISNCDIERQPRLTDSSTVLNESPIYMEEEFNFSRVELRKSSSLKSNKTPPGTPHRKKVVRFADAMGLDLESVRHVLNMESPPKIPPSALADLISGMEEENKDIGSKYLCPCFSQPAAADNFFQKVRNQKVSLENAIINDLTITGFVRVSNIAYNKSVRIRYTCNSWSSFYDIAASYVQNSCDGPTDRFSFSIVAPPYFGPSSRLQFAVCYIAEGIEHWDNNDGKNYVFECFAKSLPTDSETAWLHFL